MKTPLTPAFFAGALLSSAFLFAQPATAADTPIVSWGASSLYVGGHTNGTGLVAGEVSFSDTIARSPGSPYPNGESSGTFYGGAVSANSAGITLWRVSNGNAPANDAITFGGALAASEASTALYLWKKADFLAGYGSQAAAVTSFSATLQHTGSGSLMSGSARWVVQVAGSYYVSDAFSTTTTATQYTLADPGSVSWFSLNPATSLTSVGGQWVSPDFSDVSSVGLWWQLAATGNVATAVGNISEFKATAIPEPAGMALLAGGLIGGATLIARPKK